MSDVVERAKAALEGVTEGPWESTGGVVWHVEIIAVPDPNDPSGQTPMPEPYQEMVCETGEGDAPFIAAARTLVPELVAEVERLHGLLAELTDPDECWFDHGGGCQAHGFLSLQPGEVCPNELARRAIGGNS